MPDDPHITPEINEITMNEPIRIDAVITKRTRDRQGDLIEPTGLDFGNYSKNPVVLWVHDTTQAPVGKIIDIKVTPDEAIATVEFADTPMGQEIGSLYKTGFLKGWSIGFIPTQWEELSQEAPIPSPYDYEERRQSFYSREKKKALVYKSYGDAALLDEPGGDPPESKKKSGLRILKAEVVEVSCVPIPANPQALTKGLPTWFANGAEKYKTLVTSKPSPITINPKPNDTPFLKVQDLLTLGTRLLDRLNVNRLV